MSPQYFKRALLALYGPNWVHDAGVALEIRTDKISRMARGIELIYPHTAARIEQLVADRKIQLGGKE